MNPPPRCAVITAPRFLRLSQDRRSFRKKFAGLPPRDSHEDVRPKMCRGSAGCWASASDRSTPCRFHAARGDGGVTPEDTGIGAPEKEADTLRGNDFCSVLIWMRDPRRQWRRVRDSNPRYPSGYAGFQDRCHQPLGQLSAPATVLLQAAVFLSPSDLHLLNAMRDGLRLAWPVARCTLVHGLLLVECVLSAPLFVLGFFLSF